MARPDVELTEVRRQAEGSAILELATLLRTERRVLVPCGRYGEVQLFERHPAELFAELYERYSGDVVYLVGKNSTRVVANCAIRNQLFGVERAKEEKLVVGESLLAISNNNFYANGSLLRVAEIRADLGKNVLTRTARGGTSGPLREYYYRYDVVDDEGREFRLFLFPATEAPSIHNREIPELNRAIRGKTRTDNNVVVATYGNALSVHKSQGGQWKAVMLYPEFPFADDARWLYTGITRAQSELHLNIENIRPPRRVLPYALRRMAGSLISPAD
ncbi:MAG: ATP-binding domain-containing protein [Oligoflexia bacterium]|nr:ATP-binding domain-containing protein [Oligoflexia bacterium]